MDRTNEFDLHDAIGQLRPSAGITRELMSEAVTYNKVITIHAQGVRTVYELDCEHIQLDTERNPAHVGQVRFCSECTECKRQQNGAYR